MPLSTAHTYESVDDSSLSYILSRKPTDLKGLKSYEISINGIAFSIYLKQIMT